MASAVRWLLLGLLVGWLTTMPVTASAEPSLSIERALPHAVLRGTEGELVAVLEFDEPSRRLTVPVLALQLTASGLVDLRRSTLTLALGDHPLVTQRLDTWIGRGGRLELTLPYAPAGFHSLRLTAHLVPLDDECEQDPERRLWLAVTGAVAWRARNAPPPAMGGQSPAQVLASYAAAPEFTLSGRDPVDTALAYLEADRWRRRLGLPEHEAPPRLRATTVWSASSEEGALVRALTAAPHASAIVGVVAGTLTIVAAPGTPLPTAVRSAAAALPACTQPLCWLSARPEPKEAASTPASEVVVWRLQQERPSGFVATGTGSHAVRWTWQRPRRWKVVAWPELRLQLASSPRVGVASTLTVRFGDIPLATFALEQPTAQYVVRLPQFVWTQPSWPLSVELNLRGSDSARCAASYGPDVWVRLDPDSSLSVPRDQPEPSGLADFLSDPQQPEIWLEGEASDDELARFAAIANQVPGDQPWRAAPSWQACQPRCLALRTTLPPGSRWTPIFIEGGAGWRAPHGELPLVSAARASLLELQRDRDATRLSAILRAPDATAPDLLQLGADFAMWADGWRSPPSRESKMSSVRGDDGGRAAPLATSREQRSHTRFDAIWLAVVAVVALLLAGWLARTRRARS